MWYQQASIGDRLSRITDSFRDFEWLDLSNFRHREAIDDRLNQNEFIGMAVARLELGAVEYASGDTLGKVAMGLIPRVFWPDKPAVGGGGSVVHDFTGLEFAEGTSFGAGQVFEFYVNFGSLGVIGGFLLYGWLIGRMDLSVIKYLRQGDQRRFLLWFLPCLALLSPVAISSKSLWVRSARPSPATVSAISCLDAGPLVISLSKGRLSEGPHELAVEIAGHARR